MTESEKKPIPADGVDGGRDMERYPPIDCEGRDLRVGDWVLVVTAPVSIQGMPAESLQAFSSAIGHTFQIQDFDQLGCLHLDLYPKISRDSIFIEPFCVRRSRRYKKLSQEFLRRQEFVKSLAEEPRLEIEFEAFLEQGSDLEAFGLEMISGETTPIETTGSFAIWPEEGRVQGSIRLEVEDQVAEDSKAGDSDAHALLEFLKDATNGRAEVRSIEFGALRRSKKAQQV